MPNILPGSNVTPTATVTANNPNAGRLSVAGFPLSSYPQNQPAPTAVGGGPVHISTPTPGAGGANTDAQGNIISQGQQGAFTPTLNANITTPDTTTKTAPPAVITSDKAQGNANDIGANLTQAQTDAQTAAATKAQASVNSQTQTNSDANQTTSPTPDDQIKAIYDAMNTDSDANQTQASATEDQLLSQEAQNQVDQATAYQNMQNQFDAIRNGTYPLTQAEQSVLSATQQQFQSVIQYQQQANTAYTGQMKEAMASLGIDISAPTQAIGNIQATITSGSSKIADLNSQMALALSNATVAFQKQAFDELQTQWSNAAQQFQSRQSTLGDMLTSVTAQAKAAQDEINTRAQTGLTAIMDSNTISYQAKQQALAQSQLNETMRHDAVDEAQSRFEYTSDGQVFDKQTGQVSLANPNIGGATNTTPGKTGIPLLDSNTQVTASGVPYIDGTNLTGAQAVLAQKYAANLGITYIGPKQAAAVQKIETARQNLANIDQVLQGISPSNGLSRLLEIPNYGAESMTQNGPEASAISAYNTFRSAAIEALQAVAGGAGSGLRINQAEIQMSIDNDIPKPTDTAAVRDQKLANMKSLLDSNEQQLFGTSTWNKYNPDSGSAQASNALDSIMGTGGQGLTSGASGQLDSIASSTGL